MGKREQENYFLDTKDRPYRKRLRPTILKWIKNAHSEVVEGIKTTFLKRKIQLLPKFEVNWTKMRRNYL